MGDSGEQVLLLKGLSEKKCAKKMKIKRKISLNLPKVPLQTPALQLACGNESFLH